MTDIETAPPGWRDLLAGGNAARTLATAGGIALHAVSIYVVATIMPLVVAELGGIAFFAWTATLYIAGSLCGAAAVPLLIARMGPRGAYRLAFASFLAGSLACALAPHMAVLLLGRTVQGIGGGMLPALAYASVRSVFPPALHARILTLLGTVWGVAALLGPTLGGVVAQFGNWRMGFWIDVPIGLAFALLANRVIPVQGDATPPRPFPGLRLALLALAAVGVGTGGLTGRPGPAALGVVAAGVLLAAMLRLDARAPRRMLPAGAFNPATPLGAASAALGLLILASSPCNFVALILRAGHGVAPIVGGYMSALVALSWTATSLVTAGFGRAGTRACIVAAPLAILAGLLLQGWALRAGPLPAVAGAQILVGGGIGLAWAHLQALLLRVAPAADRDLAGPFLSLTQTLAAVFGSALAGMAANLAGLATAASPAAVAAVAPPLFASLAVAAALGTGVAWQVLRLTRFQPA